MPDNAAFALHCAFYGEVGAALDETQVVNVGGCRPREIPALLDEHLLRAEHFRKLLAEPFAGVYRVEFDVPESVAGNFLALCLHFGDDGLYARALGDEDVHAVVFVHDFFQARGFLGDVELHLGNVDGVDVAAHFREPEPVGEFALREKLAVLGGGRGGEPPAVAPHDFVDYQHARVGAVFGYDVTEEFCALFGGSPRAEALAYRVDVVVYGLGQPDYGELVIVFFQEFRKIRGGGIGVVPADGVEDVNLVLYELVGGDLLGVFALLDEAALHAVLDVGELHARVAYGRAAVPVQNVRLGAHFVVHLYALSEQEPLVSAEVADYFNGGVYFGVAFDEPAYCAREARGEPARR